MDKIVEHARSREVESERGKRQLIELRQSVLEQKKKFLLDQAYAEYNPDWCDYARPLRDENTIRKKLHNIDERLQIIERALGRIKDGSYGTCAKCGKQIANRELFLAPEQELCKECFKNQV